MIVPPPLGSSSGSPNAPREDLRTSKHRLRRLEIESSTET